MLALDLFDVPGALGLVEHEDVLPRQAALLAVGQHDSVQVLDEHGAAQRVLQDVDERAVS